MNSKPSNKITPLVQSLSGIITLPENYDLKEDYTSYLMKKYQADYPAPEAPAPLTNHLSGKGHIYNKFVTLPMPTVLREKGFRFFFYSEEGKEPAHIHVAKGNAEGKIWLNPEFAVTFLHGFTPSEEKALTAIAIKYTDYFKEKWYEHFGQ